MHYVPVRDKTTVMQYAVLLDQIKTKQYAKIIIKLFNRLLQTLQTVTEYRSRIRKLYARQHESR